MADESLAWDHTGEKLTKAIIASNQEWDGWNVMADRLQNPDRNTSGLFNVSRPTVSVATEAQRLWDPLDNPQQLPFSATVSKLDGLGEQLYRKETTAPFPPFRELEQQIYVMTEEGRRHLPSKQSIPIMLHSTPK